jgi:hypothetical protein
VDLRKNVFQFTIASSHLVSFVVSLGGLRHGQLSAVFSLCPFDCLDLSGPTQPPFGPPSPPVSYVTPVPVSLSPVASGSSGPPGLLTSLRPISADTLADGEPIGCDKILPLPIPLATTVAKKHRSPLCISLLSPGLLPTPAGPLPWPTHPPVSFPPLPVLLAPLLPRCSSCPLNPFRFRPLARRRVNFPFRPLR